jgi:hypothetical protein
MTEAEATVFVLKREAQCRDALAKAAALCHGAKEFKLRDAIHGLATTYGFRPAAYSLRGVSLAQSVAASLLELFRANPGRMYAPGDLRADLDPIPTLGTWNEVVQLIQANPDVRAEGWGPTRRYGLALHLIETPA